MSTSESYLIIGGSGFLGRSIVEALVKRGEKNVATLDIVQRYHDVPHYTGNITDSAKVREVLKTARTTTIIHTASPIHNLAPEIYYKVNVQGTLTIVQAAMACGVPRLVFTSSSGVVDAGIDLIDADERLPYPDEFLDAYNESKALAEKIVLEANGRNGLLTVALRPAGIFGPGDRQMIPSFAKVINNKQTHFQIGSNANIYDMTYIDNVVHAHILAADRLKECSTNPASYTLPRSALIEFSLEYSTLSTGYRRVPTSDASPLGPVDGAPSKEAQAAAAVFFAEDYVENRPVSRTKFDPLSDTALDLEEVLVPSTEAPAITEKPHTNGAAAPLPDSPFLPETVTYTAKGTSLPHPSSVLTQNMLQVPGQAFFITNGEPVYFWDFARTIWNEMGDTTTRRIALPKEVGLVLGTLSEWVSWALGKEPGFTRFRVAVTSNSRWFNIEKSRRVLGYEPQVGLEEGIKRSVAWFNAQGGLASVVPH
ncbi:erg26, C-3 sterol dehydrogenase [Tulasnella sp. JGI-2019a]|nr:erg26, C-3 sterol dehydrogenase [Tulasnella sp. JGI-2019a]KAG9003210.1 erg26, C-3 sterol dehydrogenase [Tulasnella sp. JGI-2019a]